MLCACLVVAAVAVPASAATTHYCFGKKATIVGTPGNDMADMYEGMGADLTGTNGPDVIVGLGGKDSIYGAGGNDYICAGPGNDGWDRLDGLASIEGGPGDDWVSGGDGVDTLQGSSGGRDHMYGDKGNDSLTDGQGYHEYSFPDSSGGDWLFGGPGHDRLDTTYGNDYLNGGLGDDRLGLTPQEADDLDTCCEPYPYDVGSDEYIGGGGHDRLAGKDFINGNDLIHGDLGLDACLGDAGDQIRGCEELVE